MIEGEIISEHQYDVTIKLRSTSKVLPMDAQRIQDAIEAVYARDGVKAEVSVRHTWEFVADNRVR